MNAEVISIGDELTSGQRLDTNSQWLSERLGELGVRVLFHTTVGDDLAANVRVLREAVDRADLIVMTGGLGPTADDLTREAVAEAMGVDLVQDDAALAHIRALFARRQRPMPERNVVQALFPRGSRVIPNPHGSAPGIDADMPRATRADVVDRSACRLFALPGVPAEMREMWEATVGPAIAAMQGDRPSVIRHRAIRCFGVGESDLEAMLPDLIRRGREPSVGITVSQATITLRITAGGATADEAFRSMEPTVATIRECLGDLVFGEGDDELQHAVARLLRERGETMTTCEWGTGGLIAHWLSDVDPRHEFFRGGSLLRTPHGFAAQGLSTDIAAPHDSLAARMDVDSMRQWAERVREMFEADYSLAVGPFPTSNAGGGPSSSAAPAAANSVPCAVVGPNGFAAAELPFSGHPDILLQRTAKSALNLLRKKIIERS